MTKNTPVDTQLYKKVVADAKKKFMVWPSAYASGWVVRRYKALGGTYTTSGQKSSQPLKRWFDEEWVDVCTYLKNKTFQPCGRRRADWKDYPYCRPRKRVSQETPKTLSQVISEYGQEELRRRCEKKKKNPEKRVSSRARGGH